MNVTKITRVLSILTAVGGVLVATSLSAYAATLTTASLSLSDARVSQTSQYSFTASGWTTGTAIGCIEVDLGTANDGSGTIAGLNTASSTFVSESITASASGWAVDNSQSSSAKLRITNATPVNPQGGSQTVTWGAVTNGSTSNTGYFALVKTYTTNACSTPVDSSLVQFTYTDGQAASVSVDPSLSFSVASVASGGTVNGATTNVTTTSTTIPFGTATIATNKIAAQSLSVSTNAGSGYTVYTRYTGQLNNGGGGTIADLAGATNAAPTAFSAAGTEAFGYTTESTTLGTGTANRFSGGKWAAFTTNNAEVAYNSAPVASDVTKVGFQVGVAGNTKAGTYNTTVIYTATPVY